jgi:hypothetical protein
MRGGIVLALAEEAPAGPVMRPGRIPGYDRAAA